MMPKVNPPSRRFLLTLLVAFVRADGAQSILTEGGNGTISLPASTMENSRVELRISDVQPCARGNSYGNIFRIRNLFGLSCQTAGSTAISHYNVSGSARPIQLNAGDDVTIRLQRFGAAGRFGWEIWRQDGKKLGNLSYNHGQAQKSAAIQQGLHELVGNSGGMKIAWIRWYSTVVPENSPMPKDSGPAGDLGSWNFEGSLADSSGRGHNVSKPDAAYAESRVNPPVVQFAAPEARVGSVLTLDASASFTYDGTGLKTFSWDQVGGPTKVEFSDRQSATPTLTGLSAGVYYFKLTAVDSGGKSASKVNAVRVRDLDSQGFDRLPGSRTPLPSTAPAAVARNVASVQSLAASPPSGSASAAPYINFYLKLWPLSNYELGSPYLRDRVGEFLSSKTDSFSGGEISVRRWNASASQPVYTDHAGIYPSELYQLRESATRHGYNAEDLLMHMGRDYHTAGGYVWNGQDMFDYAAANTAAPALNAANSNGAVLVTGEANFVDVTLAAYTGDPKKANELGDVPLQEKLLLGAADPFDEVNFVVASPALSVAVGWQYWSSKGWADLKVASDGTEVNGQKLGKDGQVRFVPPADWTLSKQAGGSREKWWIRVSVHGNGAPTKTPVLTSMKGDHWRVLKYADLAGWTVGHEVVFGEAAQFRSMVITLKTPRSGGAVPSLQFWNGTAWENLPIEDGTNGLTSNGTISFAPPAKWSVRNFYGGERGYYLRWIFTGSPGPSTAPVLASAESTNKVPLKIVTTSRGWCADAPGRINVGLGALEYNPSPPSECSARFRHQARTLGIWANNNHFFNISNVQKNERTAARFVVDKVGDKLASGWNGVFVDNAIPAPTISTPPNWRSLTEMASKNFINESVESYKQVGSYMRSHPGWEKYVLCANNTTWILNQWSNCFYDEGYKHTYQGVEGTYYPLYVNGTGLTQPPTDNDSANADQLRPENNPNGVKSLYAVWDTENTEWARGSTFIRWDKANRTPLIVLSSCLIWGNPNVRCMYLTTGGFIYKRLDNFWHALEDAEWVTTSSIEGAGAFPSVSGAAKTVKLDPASFESFPQTLEVRMGESGEFVKWTKGKDNMLTTNEIIGQDYPAGTNLFRVVEKHMAVDPLPAMERIKEWGQYLPAMNADIGVPDQKGYNCGERDLQWRTQAQVGTTQGYQRRDYTKAIVLHSTAYNIGNAYQRLNEYGAEIVFATLRAAKSCAGKGGSSTEAMPAVLYPLRADGSTGPGIKSIRLRTAEGAILMKEPIGSNREGINIDSVAVADLQPNSATITWRSHSPATSQIEFGAGTEYGGETQTDANKVTSHRQVLSGLKSGTTYHFRVRGTNAEGVSSISGDRLFRTP